MFTVKAALSLLLATSIGGALGNSYSIKNDISGQGFLSAFQHEAIGDPTHGRGCVVSLIHMCGAWIVSQRERSTRSTWSALLENPLLMPIFRNYVSQSVALRNNLTYAHDNTFVIRVDSTSHVNANGPGRNTVRLMSNEQFHNHVAVFNIRHMPQGCG